MESLQIRLAEDDVRALDALAARLRASRSEAARRAIDEGLRVLRMEDAFQRFLEGEVSLGRAAELAGVSLQRMAQHAADRGVPVVRYDADEVVRDAARVRRALEAGEQA